MMPVSKQIVVDKSAFDGIKTDALCHFAKHHFLVAPGVLFYECATSEDHKKKSLKKYQRLIEEGACCCPRGQELVQWEARHCRPYPLFLAAAEGLTRNVCRGEVQLDEVLKPTDARQWERSCTREACEKYIESSEIAKRQILQNCSNVREEIKDFPSDQLARWRFILNLIDTTVDVQGMAVRSLPSDSIMAEEKSCLSDEWITWHRMRLASAIGYEYSYRNLKHGNTPGETKAEHDDQDGEYVLLLCRADAIITQDKGLIELAHAAFPEKDVFSSLRDVPESYRCDWTDG